MAAYSLTGARITHSPITYTFADFGSLANITYDQDAATPFSGRIGAGYGQVDIKIAFARWAAVSGLVFTYVFDTADASKAADIRIGYADLGSPTTGVYASTRLGAVSGGAIGRDTLIRIEDPFLSNIHQDGTVLAYNANNQTDYQLALREIGHALGLGDSTDSASVMYPVASALNRDLSAADIQGIRAAYAATTTVHGNPADYTVATLASGATLVRDDANYSRDGSQTVQNLGTVAFGDGSVGLIDTTGNAETMARLYQAAFSRAPDLAGLKTYTALLDGGSIGLPAIADGFVSSGEYQRAYGTTDTAGFVNQLYRNVLHRDINPSDPGDSGAAQQWANLVNARGRGAALIAFADSQENHRLTLGVAGDKYDAEAARLYKAAFNRAADAPGLASTRNALANGASTETVAQGFVGSGEFQRAYGSLSPSDVVAQLYRNVLGREADASGKAQFVGALDAGYSRGYVLAALSDSDENRIATAGATHDGWVLARL